MRFILFLLIFYTTILFAFPNIENIERGSVGVIEVTGELSEVDRTKIKNHFTKELMTQRYKVVERGKDLEFIFKAIEIDGKIAEGVVNELKMRGINFVLLIKVYPDIEDDEEARISVNMIDLKSVNIFPPYEENWDLIEPIGKKKQIEIEKRIELVTNYKETGKILLALSLNIDIALVRSEIPTVFSGTTTDEMTIEKYTLNYGNMFYDRFFIKLGLGHVKVYTGKRVDNKDYMSGTSLSVDIGLNYLLFRVGAGMSMFEMKDKAQSDLTFYAEFYIFRAGYYTITDDISIKDPEVKSKKLTGLFIGFSLDTYTIHKALEDVNVW